MMDLFLQLLLVWERDEKHVIPWIMLIQHNQFETYQTDLRVAWSGWGRDHTLPGHDNLFNGTSKLFTNHCKQLKEHTQIINAY